jgi:hypothetical protein
LIYSGESGYAGYLFSSVLPLATTYEAALVTQTPNTEHNKENKGDNKRIHDLSILTLNDTLILVSRTNNREETKEYRVRKTERGREK